ncbi:DUF2939 domain-containing protein [Polaromonas sp. P1(28)-13]|nr:DUF2939 domain-containing protein [Polaromonas sp. P1(28)-13]
MAHDIKNNQSGRGRRRRGRRKLLVLVPVPSGTAAPVSRPKKDADAFNERVDYPKLRESIKGQLSALLGEQMAKTQDAGNPFAALGSMLGMAMVDRFVDAMVRP